MIAAYPSRIMHTQNFDLKSRGLNSLLTGCLNLTAGSKLQSSADLSLAAPWSPTDGILSILLGSPSCLLRALGPRDPRVVMPGYGAFLPWEEALCLSPMQVWLGSGFSAVIQKSHLSRTNRPELCREAGWSTPVGAYLWGRGFGAWL